MRRFFNWFVFLILIISSLKTFSQSFYVMGKVINEQSKLPLQNANVLLLNKDDQNLIKTTTDSLGLFKIQKDYLKLATKLKITYLNVVDIHPLKIDKSNSLFNIDLGVFKFKLPPQVLKEVNIRSKKRYHDTTKIDLSDQKFERSFMIDDLLHQQFGFSKDENGQLYYNGKIVSNLTVNGKDFFGQNTKDIYKMLPALIIDNIQVVETNVDTLTNTTSLRPTIKVNLQLKDKYGSGKFGNSTLGIGSSDRYLASFDIYAYGNTDQLSLKIKSDNINKNTTPDPSLDFGTNGSNQTNNISQLAYKKTWNNKLEIGVLIDGRNENSITNMNTQRNEEIIKQVSNFFTSSTSNVYEIEHSNFNFKFNIDPLSTLTINEIVSYRNSKQNDSSSYSITSDSTRNFSNLKRSTSSLNSSFANKTSYQRKFLSLPGRMFNLELNQERNSYLVNETDADNSIANTYDINSKRIITGDVYKINASFNEPLGESAYCKILTSYKNEVNSYTVNLNNDSINNLQNIFNNISNHYIEGGLIFHRTFEKISMDQSINETFYNRAISFSKQESRTNFNYLWFSFKLDYKINKVKSLFLNLNSSINYPNITQLTSINNSSYDPLFEQTSNISLKPEIDRGISFNYNLNGNDLTRYTYFARFDLFESKIGLNISSMGNGGQISYFDNVGNSSTGMLGFTLFKQTVNENHFSLTTNLSYSETPLIENQIKLLNSTLVLNQSLSAKIGWIKNYWLSLPVISLSVGKIGYGPGSTDQFNLIYIDKQSFTIKQFTINTYSLFNINRTINFTKTFGVNLEIKKTILNKYGFIWLKAYDILNTYRVLNNSYGASYIQTSNYLNLNRYIIFGLSVNFNNMK